MEVLINCLRLLFICTHPVKVDKPEFQKKLPNSVKDNLYKVKEQKIKENKENAKKENFEYTKDNEKLRKTDSHESVTNSEHLYANPR